MSVQDAADALHARLLDSVASADDSCVEYLLPDAARNGEVAIMAVDGKIVRVSMFAPGLGVRTSEGIGIGSPDGEVHAAYPNVTREFAPYDGPPAHDLVAWRRQEVDGIRFEIDRHGRVESMHAGNRAITYIEGCL